MSVNIKKVYKSAQVSFEKLSKEEFELAVLSLKKVTDSKYDKTTRYWTVPDTGIEYLESILTLNGIKVNTIEDPDIAAHQISLACTPYNKWKIEPEVPQVKKISPIAEVKPQVIVVRSANFFIVKALTISALIALDHIPKLYQKLPESVIDIHYYEDIIRICKANDFL